MHTNAKEWLVRTRSGEILGPFTQRELLEELGRRTFTVDDEIAPSQGQWISAQALGNRDSDEFTRTSTRSHAFTRSVSTTSSTVSSSGASSATDKLISGHGESADEREELTPTPDFTQDRIVFEAPPLRYSPRADRKSRIGPTRIAPLVSLLFALVATWAILTTVKARKAALHGTDGASAGRASSQGESPFVRNIYDLITRGQTRTALQQLTQYHERNAAKGDLEYLIPYSALLIIDGESESRARKFLEQILQSSSSPQLKARAHHWLGYLMLKEGENDMGESHFLETLQINPKDAAARFNLGRAYLKQQKFSQALDYLQLAELERPDLWLIHIYKGRAKEALGMTNEARVAFRTAIEKAPDRWLSYIYLALFLEHNGDHDAAEATMKKMLTRDSQYEVNSPVPWGFFQEKIDYEEYLSAFNEVMGRSVGEEKELGKLFINYLLNRPSGSEGAKIEAVADKGGLFSKVFALKVVLDREATPDEIRTAVNRLSGSLLDFGYYAYVLRAEARARLGNLTEAQFDFKKALELEPKSAVAQFGMALLLRKMQRTDDALSEMRGLLALHPNYIPALLSTSN